MADAEAATGFRVDEVAEFIADFGEAEGSEEIIFRFGRGGGPRGGGGAVDASDEEDDWCTSAAILGLRGGTGGGVSPATDVEEVPGDLSQFITLDIPEYILFYGYDMYMYNKTSTKFTIDK